MNKIFFPIYPKKALERQICFKHEMNPDHICDTKLSLKANWIVYVQISFEKRPQLDLNPLHINHIRD